MGGNDLMERWEGKMGNEVATERIGWKDMMEGLEKGKDDGREVGIEGKEGTLSHKHTHSFTHTNTPLSPHTSYWDTYLHETTTYHQVFVVQIVPPAKFDDDLFVEDL